MKKYVITNFAKRHFDPKFGGTKILDYNPAEFECMLNNNDDYPYVVENGYADFCKILTMHNFTNAKTGSLAITLENYQYLRSGYSTRREGELPVLSRWFELPVSKPTAKYLSVVVYNYEQLKKEYDADIKKLNNKYGNECYEPAPFELEDESQWGIVCILAHMGVKTDPMKPATMLRNALGVEEGGSGVPLDREEYLKSVEFWENHATVK